MNDHTTVTEQMIYEAAWTKFLADWAKEKERLEERPESEILKERTENAWQRVKNLEAMMMAKGYRE